MALFDFKLRPLHEVQPWGGMDGPDDLCLHWFGLTDGCFSIDCGIARLFQYTPEMLVKWEIPSPDEWNPTAWVDYPIIRLYEDVIDLLQHVLVELPSDFHRLVSDVASHRAWRENLRQIAESDDWDEGDEDMSQCYLLVLQWMGYRKLDSSYLVDGPETWFWRHSDEIYVLWDNEDSVADGFPRWTAASGVISMSVERFLGEVESFHHRLMASMQDRIHEIAFANPFKGVKIDIPYLFLVQKQRERSLANALAAAPEEPDWEKVRHAMRMLGCAI
ncbi:MAG: hypothetical protein J0M04_14440 [Verrucomicrobia bacterium]|nr:hypothetical protein [Verrucomicrobiota bacterium]